VCFVTELLLELVGPHAAGTHAMHVQVVYCAGSRVALTIEYNRTENIGVGYMARAWLDQQHAYSMRRTGRSTELNKNIVCHFSKPEAQNSWNILFCGPLDPREQQYGLQDAANVLISEDGNRLVFVGVLHSADLPSASVVAWVAKYGHH
jgi:hypothetical protein